MQIDLAQLPRLADLPSPPSALYLRGALPSGPSLAIVGTRRADPDAMAFTRRLARRAAEAGAAIVSGGAEGIDAAAHLGALDAGRYTLVVQAAPLEKPYPRRHRRLFESVLELGGGWLSETPPGQAPHKGRFLARNRIIAALADAVLIVQAPSVSGALSTARWAKELGRPLFAVPASPWDPRGEGGARLLLDGATPCLDACDLGEALGLCLDARPPRPAAPDPDGDPGEVLRALGRRPRHPDELARRTGLGAARVTMALVRLRLLGLAQAGPRGWRAAGAGRAE